LPARKAKAPASPAVAAPAPAGLRPVLVAWVLLAVLTTLPYVRAALAPPAGRVFAGFFWFIDDSYNYLSFVQQAASGRVLFENKLVLQPHAPALFNLEWLIVGWLTALLGGSPLVAYRLFGLAAAFPLVWGIDHWLRRSGLPDRGRLPALLLVATGGGLGGLATTLGSLSYTDAIDLSTGLFPALELLMSPHFVAATALFLWTLAALVEERTLPALLLGSALALTRPYDFVLVVLVRVAGVALGYAPRLWLRKLLPLAGYLPVVAYNYWLFYRNPAFTTFHAVNELIFPPWYAFAVALLPGLVLAGAVFRGLPGGDARQYWLHLLAWIAAALAIIAAPPVHFALQFLAGIGVPILVLAALGLARFPRALPAAAIGMSSTAVVALVMILGPDKRWFVPTEAFAVAPALAPACHEGDLALTAGATGLYVGGLTPCRAYSSHANEPGHETRRQELAWFYGAASPRERADFLDTRCVRFVLLPRRSVPEEYLGRAPKARAAETATLALYEWPAASGCARAAD
jgi:hypothetical protein